jgi:hypothetical protein
MLNFAVIDGINVINTIICDSQELAEQTTGFTCVEIKEFDAATPGGTYVDGVFINPSPVYEPPAIDEVNN